MSSFWNLFSDKKENESPSGEGAPGENVSAPGQVPTPTAPEVYQQMKAPEPPKPPPSPKQNPHYGIDDAIKLMRTLPVDDNVDLVVRVIKRTLESLAVRVPEIVEDASKRQEALRTKIAEHKTAIVQLEREIDARRFEIARLEEDLAETTQVRERLQLAEATAMSVTPGPSKTSNAAIPLKLGPDALLKKVEVPPPGGVVAQQRSAPPLPASFRPKPTTPEAVAFVGGGVPASAVGAKKPEPAFPAVGDKDDEEPVESKDMFDKD